jgi:hypothetical protein
MTSVDLSDYVIGDTFRLIQASYVQIPPCDLLNERDPEFLQVCKFFGSFYQEPSQLLPSQPLNLALGTVLNCDERNIDGETFLSRRAIVVRSSEIFLFGFSHLQWIVSNQKNDTFLCNNLLPLFTPFDLVCFAGTMVRAKHTGSLWMPAYRVANDTIVFVAVDTGFSDDMAIACTRSQYTRKDHTY